MCVGLQGICSIRTLGVAVMPCVPTVVTKRRHDYNGTILAAAAITVQLCLRRRLSPRGSGDYWQITRIWHQGRRVFTLVAVVSV